MLIPVFLISLSCALLTLLGGLFLLAYAKKEGLGKLTKIGAYIAIVFGTLVFLGGIVSATMCGSCHEGGCKTNKMTCPMEMHHKMKKMDCHHHSGKMNCAMPPMEGNCHKKMCPTDSMKCEAGAKMKCCKSDSTMKK